MNNLDPLSIEVENGFIILEGNSLRLTQPYHYERKKWVARDASELTQIIYQLATQGKVTQK